MNVCGNQRWIKKALSFSETIRDNLLRKKLMIRQNSCFIHSCFLINKFGTSYKNLNQNKGSMNRLIKDLKMVDLVLTNSIFGKVLRPKRSVCITVHYFTVKMLGLAPDRSVVPCLAAKLTTGTQNIVDLLVRSNLRPTEFFHSNLIILFAICVTSPAGNKFMFAQ